MTTFKEFKSMTIPAGSGLLFDRRDGSVRACSDREARKIFSQYDRAGLVAYGDGVIWEWASHLSSSCPFVYRANLSR